MVSQSQWHFANIWENVAKTVPGAPAIVTETKRMTWREYEARAAKIASVYRTHGLAAGAKISIYSYNSAEYLEAQFGAFKARMTTVNVNYRYLETELAHVITNSDSEAVVYQAGFAPRLAAIQDQLPMVKLFLEIDDGSGEHLDGAVRYEEALAAADPMPVIERSSDDLYLMYTGGTTGLPKGVMYDHRTLCENLLFRSLKLFQIDPPESHDDIPRIVNIMKDAGLTSNAMPGCPLMHGTGMWIGVLIPHSFGGCTTLFDNRAFDPDVMLGMIEKEGVKETVIVGDVFAKPLVKAIENAKARGKPYDLSSLKVVHSSGVMWSMESKQALLDHADVMILDSIGSSEGTMGSSVITRDSITGYKTGQFNRLETTKIFTEDGREVEPGSDETGLVHAAGMVPLGYYKDEAKSAATFKTIDGIRYSIPGDYAKVDADGNIILLGRGSMCINSGGEKIYPEEVEEVMKQHPAIDDCLIVGVPDDRFGQSVTALYSVNEGAAASKDELKAHVRGLLADYKAPRSYIETPDVPRAANGKADYKVALHMAKQALGIEDAA